MQNIDCGYLLEPPRRFDAEAVLTSTHNLCFKANGKKKNSNTPANPSFSILFMEMFSRWFVKRHLRRFVSLPREWTSGKFSSVALGSSPGQSTFFFRPVTRGLSTTELPSHSVRSHLYAVF